MSAILRLRQAARRVVGLAAESLLLSLLSKPPTVRAPAWLWSNELETMGWLSSILRALAPIAVEHGQQVLRDSLKSRTGQGPAQSAGTDAVQQLASDVEQLKAYALQLKADLDILNAAIAAREDRLRRWLLALLIWNAVMTTGLIIVAVLALRH